MSRDPLPDGTVDRSKRPLLADENRMKLAVFGFNASHGMAMTTAEGTIAATWPEQVRIAQATEEAGFDAVIPVARWKGYGGVTNLNHRSFDTLMWAAGMAAATERVHVFTTTHVPTIHPVRAAKQIATVDHISGGRVGLNVVAGWNAGEINMFGTAQREHDERYEVADEWLELLMRLWNEPDEFDFEGKYFQSPAAYSEPKPIQKGRPAIMSAGVSPRGQRFAGQHADMIFILTPTPEELPGLVKSIRDRTRENFGREIKVFTPTYIVCADTDKEAHDYWKYYVEEKGDWGAVENFLGKVTADNESMTPEQWRAKGAEIIAGSTALGLIGSAESVAQQILDLSEAGIDGITTMWVDFEEGIPYFRDRVYPLLVEMGLREK